MVTSTDLSRSEFTNLSNGTLDAEVQRRLYAHMLKCRLVENRIRMLFKQGRFKGNYYNAIG